MRVLIRPPCCGQSRRRDWTIFVSDQICEGDDDREMQENEPGAIRYWLTGPRKIIASRIAVPEFPAAYDPPVALLASFLAACIRTTISQHKRSDFIFIIYGRRPFRQTRSSFVTTAGQTFGRLTHTVLFAQIRGREFIHRAESKPICASCLLSLCGSSAAPLISCTAQHCSLILARLCGEVSSSLEHRYVLAAPASSSQVCGDHSRPGTGNTR